jgi:hypothetical protein
MKSKSNDMQARSRATSPKGDKGKRVGLEGPGSPGPSNRPRPAFLKEQDRLVLEFAKAGQAAKCGQESWLEVARHAHRLLDYLVEGVPWTEREAMAFIERGLRNRS